MKLLHHPSARPGEPDYSFFCPGCECDHGVWVKPWHGPTWSFNGDMNAPTFTPSLMVKIPSSNGMDVCHSFITDGKIKYLSDCTHRLRGKTIEMDECEK